MSTTLAPSRLGSGGDVLRVGSIGLRTRKMRAALSALGIAIGIAAIVAVFGISDSSKADLLDQLDGLGTNLLTVQVGQSLGGGTAALPLTAEQMIYRVPPVEQVSSVETVPAQVYRNDRIDSAETGGITVKAAKTGLLGVLHGSVGQGHFLNPVTERQPVVVLGSGAAP